MLRIFDPGAALMRCLGFAAIATLMLSAGTVRRAEALTLINPAGSPAAKAATDGMITEVRHGGHGGFHGGRFHGGGFHGGGARFGGFRGGHIGGFRAATPVYRPHFGGGYRYGRHHFAGYPRFYRHRHFHRPVYYGGYYPYYSYPRYHRCRIVWTYYGPRRICRWHHRHYWYHPYRYW